MLSEVMPQSSPAQAGFELSYNAIPGMMPGYRRESGYGGWHVGDWRNDEYGSPIQAGMSILQGLLSWELTSLLRSNSIPLGPGYGYPYDQFQGPVTYPDGYVNGDQGYYGPPGAVPYYDQGLTPQNQLAWTLENTFANLLGLNSGYGYAYDQGYYGYGPQYVWDQPYTPPIVYYNNGRPNIVYRNNNSAYTHPNSTIASTNQTTGLPTSTLRNGTTGTNYSTGLTTGVPQQTTRPGQTTGYTTNTPRPGEVHQPTNTTGQGYPPTNTPRPGYPTTSTPRPGYPTHQQQIAGTPQHQLDTTSQAHNAQAARQAAERAQQQALAAQQQQAQRAREQAIAQQQAAERAAAQARAQQQAQSRPAPAQPPRPVAQPAPPHPVAQATQPKKPEEHKA